MKLNIKKFLFFVILLVLQIKPVDAAKELICIYNGGLQASSTMLIQNSEGKLSVKTNLDNSVDKDDNDWWDPTSSGNDIAFNWDSSGYNGSELTDCPKYTRQKYKWNGDKSNYLYTFYFYDKKTWNHLDYSLDKKIEGEQPDEGEYNQYFNDDYTEEIANTKWIGVCEYESVTLYFNEEKMILNNKSSLVYSTRADFSYNELINKYKSTGACPPLYSESRCNAVIGNTSCSNTYSLSGDGYKQPLLNSNINDENGLYDPGVHKPIVTPQTCQSLLGDVDVKGSPAYYLHVVFNVLKYVAIILLIVLTAFDMIGAVASHDDDLIKKNVSKLIRRAIYCIIIFLLPTVIEFVLQFITVGEDGTIQLSTCYVGR